MSERSSQHFAVHVFKPTIAAGAWVPEGRFLGVYTADMDSYGHSIQALGGYWDASFKLTCSMDEAEDWLVDGCGRHVVVYDEAGHGIWEGFVNQVQATVGALSVTRGPLLDIANSVKVTYSTINSWVYPPQAGPQATTAVGTNAASIAAYGIFQKTLSAGGMATDAVACQVRDSWLAENRQPQTSKQVAFGGGAPGVTVTCAGYARLFTYAYNASSSASVTASGKLALVLAADPNGLFTAANASLYTNATAVDGYENQNRDAWNVIKTIAGIGDSAFNRYLFGIYNKRKAFYAPIPTTTYYQQLLRDPGQTITTLAGLEVEPWNILPGQWLFFPDFLVGRVRPSVPQREDPRFLFIESVKFTAPLGLALSGGKADKVSQQIARLGLSGIGG